MAYYQTPGVSIAVVNNYQIEWARGFGVCEQGRRKPVTDTTLFQAASISKPVTALAITRLAQDGKLDLDEDVNRYLTSWKVPPNGPNGSWQPRITLRQILSHTAGLTVHGFPGYNTREKIPTIPAILNGQPPANTPRIEVNLMPGVQARYSGGGTTIAGQLLVDLLGKPFPQIMQELVLDPLDLKQSTFAQPLPRRWSRYAATAHPAKSLPLEGKWHIYPELAPDGLWTTPSDLARIGIELQQALQGKGKILSQSSAKSMLTPVVDEVGIGFMLDKRRESVRFGHGGANEGFLSQMTMYTEQGLGAVIMINSGQGYSLIREIERAIAREYNWPDAMAEDPNPLKLPDSDLDKYVGAYGTKPGFACNITRTNNQLFLCVDTQPPVELYAESSTNFYTTFLNAELSFNQIDGEITGLSLLQDDRTTSALRQR